MGPARAHASAAVGISGASDGISIYTLLVYIIDNFVLKTCSALSSDCLGLPSGVCVWPGGMAGSGGEGDSIHKSPYCFVQSPIIVFNYLNYL